METRVPTPSQMRAMLHFWRSLDPQTQEVLKAAKMDPVRYWWSVAAYQAATDALAALHGVKDTTTLWAFEFETATVIGGMDTMDWCRDMKFGRLIRVRAVNLDDPFDPITSMVVHKEDSPWMMKWRQRDWLKKRLGKRYSPVVTFARKSTLQGFTVALRGGFVKHKLQYQPRIVVESLKERAAAEPEKIRIDRMDPAEGEGALVEWQAWNSPVDRYAGVERRIRSRLGMSLREFWRCSKGLDLLPASRMQERQKTLF